MNQKSNFWTIALALVAVVIAIASVLMVNGVSSTVNTALGDSAPTAGATTPGSRFPHGITVGNPAVLGGNPTNLGKLLFGTCSLIAPSFTVAATSTMPMDCAITGVTPTDGAFAQFATSTATTYGGWSVRGASASSTAGYITVSVVNGTGASAVIPASIASSTKYIILGAQ